MALDCIVSTRKGKDRHHQGMNLPISSAGWPDAPRRPNSQPWPSQNSSASAAASTMPVPITWTATRARAVSLSPLPMAVETTALAAADSPMESEVIAAVTG